MTAQRAKGYPVARPLKAPSVPDYRPAPLHRPGVPGRAPVNDPASHPFRKRFPKPAWRPPAGRRFRFPRRLPGAFGAALGLADFIDGWFPPDPGSPAGIPREAGFIRTHGPFGWERYNNGSRVLNDPPVIMSATDYNAPIAGQAVGHLSTIAANRTVIGLWWCYGTTVHRHANYERWARPTTQTSSWVWDPSVWPGSSPRQGFPSPEPSPFPWTGLPETYPFPGALPGPAPRPLPYKMLPLVPPNPFDGRWYTSPLAPAPPKAPPIVERMPPDPGRKLEHSFGVRPNGRTSSRTRQRKREDNRRKKDRKGKSRIVATAWRIINSATEAADLVGVAFDSLPKEIRDKYRGATLFQKARAVARHWEEIDINEFFVNLMANQLEDAIYGLWGRFGSKASAKLGEITGRPVGIETGEAQRQYFSRGAETQYEYDQYQRFNRERVAIGRKPITYKHWRKAYGPKDDPHPFSLPVDEFVKRAQEALTEGGFRPDRLGDHFGK